VPIVVAQQVKKLFIHVSFNSYVKENAFLLPIAEVGAKYRHMLSYGTITRIFISRVFNEQGNVVSEPKKFLNATIIKAVKYSNIADTEYPIAQGYFINIDKIYHDLSIPEGYYFEALVISLNNGNDEKVLFPYETRIDAAIIIEPKISDRFESLKKIGRFSQSYSLLASLKLGEVAEELSKGHTYYEKGDIDSSIKC